VKILGLAIAVLMAMGSFGAVGTSLTIKNLENSTNSDVTTVGEDHITNLFAPWDDCDNFDEGTGSMDTDSNALQSTGNAHGICDVWGSGWGVGNGYMEHWLNWDCPVGGIEGKIEIRYKFHADAELDVLWGGYTTAKLWLKFYIDDLEHEVILYEDFVELSGHKEYWNPTGLETWSKTLNLEKKTYKIGVQANFRLVMDMPAGTHSYCTGGFLGNWNSQDLLAIITWPNQAPDKPEILSGEKNGEINHQYKYTAVGTDMEGDALYYKWDWGDDSSQQWLQYPIDSGKERDEWHIYHLEGTFNVMVKTRDTYGAESEWSDPYTVTMPRNRAVYNPFFNLLQQHPILYHLFQLFLSK